MFDYGPAISNSNDIACDPAFVGMGNCHLTATSDAMNAGIGAGIGLDNDRDSRPWDGSFDISAGGYRDQRPVSSPGIRREP